MSKNKRRNFLKKGSLGMLGVASMMGACATPSKKHVNVNFNKTFHWKMTTTWPPNFPVLGEGCQKMANWIEKMSAGRLKITVYGGGELIPALEGFDAVSHGAVEMNHGAAYYWAGKIPASQFFAAVPFGMNAQQMNAWIVAGEGGKLWEEIYKPFNLIPLLCGNTGAQMGGWFNKKINTVEDLKGLKMRIPGLGGKVFSHAGGSPVLVAGGEIYTNLERGVIDAAEWIGPYHDYKMGLYQVAQYYYYPGWHEPGPALELMVNKDKYEALPLDLQAIIKTASMRLNQWTVCEFDAKNGEYLKKIVAEGNVKIQHFPKEVLQKLKQATQTTIDDIIQEDKQSERVYLSFLNFKKNLGSWMEMGETQFYLNA